eukprot:970643-Pleurochrysis_carterae.AAC.1
MLPDVPTDDTRPAEMDESRGPSAPNTCPSKPSACDEQAHSLLDSPETRRSHCRSTRGPCVDLRIASNA